MCNQFICYSLMGNGHFQWIPYTKTAHTLHWLQTSGKLNHLHNEMLNRLQSVLLEHDFIIQYKKGSNMPADYLSSLPSTTYKISAFGLFQVDLAHLQKQDPILKMPDNVLITGIGQQIYHNKITKTTYCKWEEKFTKTRTS